MYARRILELCAAVAISAVGASAQGPRQLTASEFRMNDQGMIVMTPLVIDRFLLAAHGRDIAGGDYWRSGGFNTQREFTLVEERVLAYLRILYYSGVAGIFSGEEQDALGKRERDLRAARDRRWSDVNFPPPEKKVSTSGEIPKNRVRMYLHLGKGTPTVINRRAKDPVRRLVNWDDTYDWLEPGSELSVPAGTWVVVELSNGSTVDVHENTILNVDDLTTRPRLSVGKGKVTARVPPSSLGLHAHFGLFVATMHSETVSEHTEFTVSHDLITGVSTTAVREGSVRVKNLATGAAVTVPKGKRVEVTQRRISELRDDNVSPSATPPSSGSLSGELARAQRPAYAPNEAVTIQYSGLPGNAQDWVNVVKRGDPDGTHGAWEYTTGKRTGTMSIPSGLAAGDYEVRVFFDWPAGSYNVRSRSSFSVGAASSAGLARAQRSTYFLNSPVLIEYSGLPGNAQDWIAVVKRSDPDNTHGTWEYTAGKRSGSITIPAGLAPGDYEVRVYFDWPTGDFKVQSRTGFNVSKSLREPIDDIVLPPVGLARAQRTSYSANEPITVEYSGLPGNQQDWIAVVKRADPDNTNGTWEYTSGKRSGTMPIPRGLAAGEYEVRVYFDWPTGGHQVRSRTSFTVR